MKIPYILFFVLLGLLQYGILLSAWSAYKSAFKPASLKYWGIALVISATSYLSFAVSVATTGELLNQVSFIHTIANILIVLAVMFQGLFTRALRTSITPKLLRTLILLSLCYGVIYELFRTLGTFEARTTLVGLTLFGIYLWQLFEIRQANKKPQSFQLKVLFSLVCAEAFFILSRVVIIYAANAQLQTIDQLPPAATLVLWLQLVLNVLAYIAMIGYWYEDITKAKVTAEYENTKMRALIDEKNRLLSELVNAKKLAELGAMSASIAHEINQPLGAIQIDVWSLKQYVESSKTNSEDEHALIDSIAKNTNRAASIIKTLRNTFRKKSSSATTLQLNELVQKIEPIIKSSKANLNLETEIPKTLHVTFNESELTLVLLNLASNAIKAGAKTIQIQASITSNHIKITVADDGIGVPAKSKSQLFEMTKESASSGMGLGLWLSRYVLERASGSISYRANKPKGAIFTLKIPKAV